ncbi:MAG: hypothetical protein RIR62_254 [Pseudomonadota bacterium]|jgi:hypothetical protein
MMKIVTALALGLTLGLAVPAAAEPVAGAAGLVTVELDLDLADSPVGDFIEVPFRLTDADGAPLTGAEVRISGGMAMHGHGLPTSPVIEELGEGRYVIKGLKFSMDGEWQVRLSVTAGAVADTVDYEFSL